MKNLRLIGLIVLLAVVCSACQSSDPEVIVVTSETVVEVVITATPEPPVSEVLPSPTTEVVVDVAATEVEGDWISSGDALTYLGETAQVRIEQAQCSFRESVNGSPTFCNDQPYPEHDFTFVVWGRDWSHYDGACVIVEGEIEVYDGKAQIVVEDENQVWACP